MQEPTNVQSLIQSVLDSRLSIPIYQRSYTWKPQQVVKLLNFIINSYDERTNQQRIPLSPILLATSTDEAATQPVSFLSDDVALPQDYFLVVDGRQRTDSLFRAHRGDFDTFIFYNTNSKQFEYKTRPNSNMFIDVPVSCLMNQANWNGLRRDLLTQEKDELYNHLNQIVDNVRLFNIHTQTAYDLSFAEQVSWFNTVNREGTKLSTEDQIIALATRHGIVFKDVLRRLRDIYRQNGYTLQSFGIQERYELSTNFMWMLPLVFDSVPSNKDKNRFVRMFSANELPEDRDIVQARINHLPNALDRAMKFTRNEIQGIDENKHIRVRNLELAFLIGALMDEDYDMMSDRKKNIVVNALKVLAQDRTTYSHIRSTYTDMRQQLDARPTVSN